MRSRFSSRRPRGKFRRTLSGASSAAPAVMDDGTKALSFRHGRVRKSNMRGVAKLQKKLMPINTHLIGSMGSLSQTTSGSAKWSIFPIGVPADVIDILNKSSAPSITDAKGGVYDQVTATGKLQADIYGTTTKGVVTAVQGTTQNAGVALLNNPEVTVDVSNLQTQINNIAARMGFGQITPGIDGRFTVYSHDTYMEIKNQVTTGVNLTIYECVPRENIMKTNTFVDFNTVLTSGFNRKNLDSSGNMPFNHRDATLYMNPIWCHYFQIAKSRAVSLKCGETLKLHMTHGNSRIINPLVLGNEIPYMALRNFTRIIIIKQTGTLVSNGADSALVDTAGTSLDYKITTKYRWNAMAKACEMITRTLPEAKGWALGQQIAASVQSGFSRPVDEDEDGPDIVVQNYVPPPQ